jgi:UDP-N-acetyl-D-galactosamine dehydrogenase
MRSDGGSNLVTVLGLTFKENVPDIRNSKVADLVRELKSFGVTVQVHDPLARAADAACQYGIELCARSELKAADAVVLAVPHQEYLAGGWPAITRLLRGGRGIVIDVKSKLDRATRPEPVELWRL